MKKRFLYWLLSTILIPISNLALADNGPQTYFHWNELPPVPNTTGLAGSFAGVAGGALIVAGGSNFPGGSAPWSGGTKAWYDNIYVLEQPGGQWKEAGKLPQPLGYGVSISWKDALICLGGNNNGGHYAGAILLRYVNGGIHTEKLPDMPRPNANASGALIGDVIYIAGGVSDPSGQQSEKFFWSLDLSQPADKRAWKVLSPWPGPSRMLSVAGTLNGAFYLFSGVHLEGTGTQRQYLKDAYRYAPGSGWTKLADMPYATAAAPGPAFSAGQSHLLIFGGDDGRYFARNMELQHQHPGFTSSITGYNVITDSWASFGNLPVEKHGDAANDPNASTWAPVTTPAVLWQGKLILPAGEARPAVRTSRVLAATPTQPSGAFRLTDWMVVGLYFLLVVGISVVVSRKMESTTNDFFLGGSKIPWWAAGLSIFGSKLSALTFIAIPAKAYATDWVYFLNNMMIVAVAPIIVYFYLPYFRKMKLTSVYQYLEIRFSPNVKLLGSLTFVLFQVSRLGIVIYLPALVLSAVTGINILICILAITVITTAYSVSGGIEAVIWTEVMQVAVLLGGALLSLVFIAKSVDGGMGQVITEAAENGKFRLAILRWDITEPVLWVVFVGGFLTQLVTYSSDQVVVQRYLTTATEKEARRSIYTNAVLVIPASLIFFAVGTALWVYFRHHPNLLNPHGNTDDVFPWYISQQLPAGLSGLVIAGLFAATMSTISSSMNSIATVVTTDFYQRFKTGTTDRQRFRFARQATLVLGVLGCGIALYLVSLHNTSIWDQYLKVIGLFGGCLAGMFLAGIFFPRINAGGVITGFIVSAVVLYFVQAAGTVNFFLYPAVAILICVIVGYVSSGFFRERVKSPELPVREKVE
jgi:SSS family transporter